MTKLQEPSQHEKMFSSAVKERLKDLVARQVPGYTIEEVALKLGLLDQGVSNMLGQAWDANKAFRVMDALGWRLEMKLYYDVELPVPPDNISTEPLAERSGQVESRSAKALHKRLGFSPIKRETQDQMLANNADDQTL